MIEYMYLIRCLLGFGQSGPGRLRISEQAKNLRVDKVQFLGIFEDSLVIWWILIFSKLGCRDPLIAFLLP